MGFRLVLAALGRGIEADPFKENLVDTPFY